MRCADEMKAAAVIAAFFIAAPATVSAGGLEDLMSASMISSVTAVPQPAQPDERTLTATSAPAASVIVEPDDSRTPVLNVINGAAKTIDLTIYELSDTQIVTALINAQKRGVAVRVLYNYYSFQTSGTDPNASAITKLSAAGVKVQKAAQTYTYTHQKTLTADNKTSVIMTFNLASNYFTGTRDFGYVTSDASQVAEIEQVFTADWNYSSITPSLGSLVWSPVNSRTKILNLINSAEKTLVADNEELMDTDCINAFEAAAKRGVSVRIITARLNGSTDSNAAGRNDVIAAGGQAKAGTKGSTGKSLYFHAKMILADYGTAQQQGFLGSENFSSTSLDENRELGVLMTDSSLLSRLSSTFESDWSAN
jgi:phosphatidylserine/phosphatidylglycerophosphate/cardiolipin synthase-like enzyme